MVKWFSFNQIFDPSQCYSREHSKWKDQNGKYRGHAIADHTTVIESEDIPPRTGLYCTLTITNIWCNLFSKILYSFVYYV